MPRCHGRATLDQHRVRPRRPGAEHAREIRPPTPRARPRRRASSRRPRGRASRPTTDGRTASHVVTTRAVGGMRARRRARYARVCGARSGRSGRVVVDDGLAPTGWRRLARSVARTALTAPVIQRSRRCWSRYAVQVAQLQGHPRQPRRHVLRNAAITPRTPPPRPRGDGHPRRASAGRRRARRLGSAPRPQRGAGGGQNRSCMGVRPWWRTFECHVQRAPRARGPRRRASTSACGTGRRW